jgi:small subunit ribosomal protein S8
VWRPWLRELSRDHTFLRYDARGTSSITHLERVSRPGRRVYVGSSEIPKVLGGYGVNIVSTSKGLMSGKSARRENMGGEKQTCIGDASLF